MQHFEFSGATRSSSPSSIETLPAHSRDTLFRVKALRMAGACSGQWPTRRHRGLLSTPLSYAVCLAWQTEANDQARKTVLGAGTY